MKPIVKYLQYMAMHPEKSFDQSEYEKDFGGTNWWAEDAVNLTKAVGIEPRKYLEQFKNAGVAYGRSVPDEDRKRTAGLRRQFVLDCLRTGKVIDMMGDI